MLARGLQRTVARVPPLASLPFVTPTWTACSVRQVASITTTHHGGFTKTMSLWKPSLETPKLLAVDNVITLPRPFSVPPAPSPTPMSAPTPQPLQTEEGMQLTSVLRKRRLKMNKHKYKKLRKRTRALRKRLGK